MNVSGPQAASCKNIGPKIGSFSQKYRANIGELDGKYRAMQGSLQGANHSIFEGEGVKDLVGARNFISSLEAFEMFLGILQRFYGIFLQILPCRIFFRPLVSACAGIFFF